MTAAAHTDAHAEPTGAAEQQACHNLLYVLCLPLWHMMLHHGCDDRLIPNGVRYRIRNT